MRRTLILALITGVPLTAAGLLLSMWLAHNSKFLGLLVVPGLFVGTLFPDETSELAWWTLFVLSQSAYYVGIAYLLNRLFGKEATTNGGDVVS